MSEQRCGTCRYWKLSQESPHPDSSIGDCTYPLPICLVDRIMLYASSGRDCPTYLDARAAQIEEGE